ncbi:NUDIX hydrolase [Xaviernesmea oryzae]|nr:NUDIX hydrolase [Xaviernesmea oryzae]SEL84187.1 8-oxo-dGTP pyrophosphatase MutT, NUDIX family [Xaviernesmea oryzae]
MTIFNRLASDMLLMFRRPARMQCAALCYRFHKKTGEPEMLVITSRDTGRWVIPKGWPMEGKTSAQAAAREAYEEAGVKGIVSEEMAGSYMYEKGMNGGLKVPCRVQVYPLVVTDMLKHFPERGSRKLDWVSFAEAAARVAEPGLKALIEQFDKELTATMHQGAATGLSA